MVAKIWLKTKKKKKDNLQYDTCKSKYFFIFLYKTTLMFEIVIWKYGMHICTDINYISRIMLIVSLQAQTK